MCIRDRGKCELRNSTKSEPQEQKKSAEIIEIVDAENTSVPLDGKIEDLIASVVRKEGFTPVSDPSAGHDGLGVVVIHECGRKTSTVDLIFICGVGSIRWT